MHVTHVSVPVGAARGSLRWPGVWRALAMLASALALWTLMGTASAAAAPAAAVPGAAVLAVDGDAPDIVLFHGEGCPHCEDEREFLADLVQRRPDLTVAQYEVWYDTANRAVLAEYEQRLGFTASGVPVTIVGDQVWVGFSESIGSQIEAALPPAAGEQADPDPPGEEGATIDVPLLGTVALADSSLIVSTLAIGFVDGVNPCSLWVLSVLLAIVLHSGSRRRVVTVGVVFLTVTAAMYGLYIVGFYSALDYLDDLAWIRLVVAAVAVTFGVLQLLDGLAPGRAPSLSISPASKPGLYRRMRGLAAAERSLPALFGGTVVLAVGVSLLETPCTAGLPLLWTSLLAEQGVPPVEAAALFALYLAVFLLDELILFGAAIVTMRATKVQERHGRALKILAGSVLVTLALAMVAVPQALTTVGGTLAVFGFSAVLTVALWGLAKWLDARASKLAHTT